MRGLLLAVRRIVRPNLLNSLILFGSAAAAHGQCIGAWYQITNTGPVPRSGHAMAYDPVHTQIVLYGGNPGAASDLGDTWIWDGANWTQAMGDSPPGPREGHTMSLDLNAQRIVLFGGDSYATGVTYLGDTWTWDGSTWVPITQNGPVARTFAASAYDSYHQGVVVFGGSSASESFQDTWALNNSTWTQVATFGLPTPPYGIAACFDPTRLVDVAFRGTDTYEWDGLFWTQTSDFGPSTRFYSGMCFDALRGKITLFGGRDQSGYPMGDTWEYNGATRLWTLVDVSGPAPRYLPAMAYDDAREALVLFGGQSNTSAFGDTWVRTAAPVLLSVPRPLFVCPSATTDIDLSVTGNGPFAYVWQAKSASGQWINLSSSQVNIDGPTSPYLQVGGWTSSQLTIRRTLRPGNPQQGEVDLRCYVSNACGTIVTNPIRRVTCVADFNCSGSLTVQDVFDFLTAWFARSPSTDVNGSGAVTVQDIFDFLRTWFAGCH